MLSPPKVWHRLTFWKSQEFKDLQAEWYARAAASGFVDIEDEKNLEQKDFFKQRIRDPAQVRTKMQRDIRREYYLLLAQYIAEKAPEFDDSIDYFVMHKFSVGFTNAQIVKALAELGKTRHRKTVMYIRRKYEDRWGIRKWKPEELHSKRMPKPS